jgi:hypothetical protein
MKMKLIISFLLIARIVNAQDTIPNGDFEYWHTGCAPGACNYCPDNWWIFCDFHQQWGFYQDADSYHGNYALRGENTSGLQSMTFKKCNLTIHPAALSCYVKSDYLSNSISITITLYKNSNPVDTGKWSGTNLVNSYNKIVIPITQNSSTADSASILILGSASSGHYFLIDYFQLDSTLTSVASIGNQTFEIYPNPTSGKFNLQMSQFENVQMKIYNVYGECIRQQINSSSNFQIDLFSQPSGIYFLQLTTDKGIARKKIVISK